MLPPVADNLTNALYLGSGWWGNHWNLLDFVRKRGAKLRLCPHCNGEIWKHGRLSTAGRAFFSNPSRKHTSNWRNLKTRLSFIVLLPPGLPFSLIRHENALQAQEFENVGLRLSVDGKHFETVLFENDDIAITHWRTRRWIRLINNYSSSPNGLWVNSPWVRRPNGLLTQRLWRREE